MLCYVSSAVMAFGRDLNIRRQGRGLIKIVKHIRTVCNPDETRKCRVLY